MRLWSGGGKRSADGFPVPSGRDAGVALSLAEADGIGRKAWAGVGLDGSLGGARRWDFGRFDIGGECSTSL